MEGSMLLPILLGVGGGMAASSLLAPKPKTPKLPEAVPLPKTQDIGKAGEKRQLQKRSTQTTMTSNWLQEPSLLSRQLG